MARAATPKTFSVLPTHLAIVPDGNGRWAERRGLPRLLGHRAGAETTRRLLRYLGTYPIKFITLYGFSTENWSRPNEEVSGLFDILVEYINIYTRELKENGYRIRHLGRIQELPEKLQDALKMAEEETRECDRLTLSLAFNYGGHAEIVDAARSLMSEGYHPEQVTEAVFEDHLYTRGMPPVDLLIRTGDEVRLSNFLIWQAAYSEYHFTRVLWPDFSKSDIDRALLSYSKRQRRFGGLQGQAQC